MARKLTAAFAAMLLLVLGLAACQKKTAEKAGEQAAPPRTDAVSWVGYTEGMKKAKETGKPAMVDFYTTWCKYCIMLDETTYKDPDVVEILNRDFVAIKLNAEGAAEVEEGGKKMTEKELAASYKVTGFPTIWFFDKKGQKIAPLPGYRPPEEFKPVLTFITSGAYEKGVEYGDYLKSLKK